MRKELEDLQWARDTTVEILGRAPYLSSWAFEYTPASSDPVDWSYLRKVHEADVVIWLVGRETTLPVRREIEEALAFGRRLWIFMLPSSDRSLETKELLSLTSLHAKRMTIDERAGFPRALELTLGDELVRAMRGRPTVHRLARLEQMGRESRARCIARWQAAGVPRARAVAFADDTAIGHVISEVQPHGNRPLVLLVGEVGLGKSLVAERMLQEAIFHARSETAAPIPVYLEAGSAAGRLREAIVAAADGLGDAASQGAAVVVDGAELAGAGAAAVLLEESRVLVNTWPNTTVVITSRPIPTLSSEEEAVAMPLLSDEDVHALVRQLSNRDVGMGYFGGLPSSLKDAIRRPLFAVLLSLFRREHAETPASTSELLFTLVRSALGGSKAEEIRADATLQRLAQLTIDRNGSPIPIAEVVDATNDSSRLLGSGLVVEHGSAISFPLPLLAQWFGAHSLAAGKPDPHELAEDQVRLHMWRQSLIIFAGVFDHETVSRVLAPISRRYPAFVSDVVDQGLARWGLAEDIAPPAWQESASRLRQAMSSWVTGLGPIAQMIAPILSDGQLRTLGVRVDDAWLTTGWRSGDGDDSSVVELPVMHPFSPPPEWSRIRGARPGRQPAWPWRWTLEELRGAMSHLLHERALPIPPSLRREEAWRTALALTGKGSLHPGPIFLADIEDRLSSIPDGAVLIGPGGGKYRSTAIREEVSVLRAAGKDSLESPWPTPDKAFQAGWVWDPYSPQRLLERTTAVYQAALSGYSELVEVWLSQFKPHLQTAVSLPAVIKGVLIPPRIDQGFAGGPVLSWYLDPLDSTQVSRVDIALGESQVNFENLKPILGKLRATRPAAAEWIGFTLHNQALDVFGPAPGTELAYRWLWDDLGRVGWVDGLFRERH